MSLPVIPDTSDGGISSVYSGSWDVLTNPLTFSVTAGQGQYFPTIVNGAYIATWDRGTYDNLLIDPNLEVSFCTARTVDSLTCDRSGTVYGTTPAKLHSSGGSADICVQAINSAIHYQIMQQWINSIQAGTADWQSITGGSDYSALSIVNGFRLTLDPSGDDGAQPDQAAPNTSANLYLVNYLGDNISLGNVLNQYDTINSGPVANAAPSPDGMYDVFATGGTAVTFVKWYTNTARNDGISTGSFLSMYLGNWKSTSSGFRYLGTVYVQSGLFQDDPTARYVWNMNNRVQRSLAVSMASYSTSSNAFAAILSVPFVVGMQDDSVNVAAYAYGAGSGSAAIELALTMNGTTPDPFGGNPLTISAASMTTGLVGTPPTVGLNAISLLARSTINTDTVTLSSPGTNHGTAIKGIILG